VSGLPQAAPSLATDSLPAAALGETREGTGFSWPLFLVLYLVTAASLIARALFNARTVPLFADTDDAMRLTNVHDFINGQDWFDIVQHRLNTPYGAVIHWSRLIDLPESLLIRGLRPFFATSDMADVVAGYIWPLLLLALLLWLSARLTLRLVGPQGLLAALALPVLSPALITEFSPGRLDHHSVQILLTLAMTLCTVEALKRPRFAIGAGIAAATGLAIGIECVPLVAAAIAAFALMWVYLPERADALRGFGLSFALASLGHLLLAAPPSRWFVPASDMLSIVYVAAAIGTGVVFALLSWLPLGERGPTARLALAALLGGVLLALLLVLFPGCLKGPYGALDPWLLENWINNITEALPLWQSLKGFDPFTIGIALPPILAVVVIGFRVWRGDAADRGEWLILGGIVLFAVLVMVLQVRGARLATAPAIPAAAWLIAAARKRYLSRASLASVAGLLGSWMATAGLAVMIVFVLLELPFAAPSSSAAGTDRNSTQACVMPQAFAGLAALPPAPIMTPIDLGSHVLLFTRHAVVAAPYHRDQQGILDTFHFFNHPIAEARQILTERGVSLVVICPAMPELRGFKDAAVDSFVRLYAKDALPPWLHDVSMPGAPLKIYSVAPQ
jgi:hypothetical protein